jgi:hypothetical protein
MDELVERIVSSVDVERPVAEKAIGIILAFLRKEGPREKVDEVIARLPGAEALLAGTAGGADSSGTGAMGMGGVMGAANRLMAAGLSMSQVQAVTQEVVAYTREKAGEDSVGEIVGAIPGLSQFV